MYFYWQILCMCSFETDWLEKNWLVKAFKNIKGELQALIRLRFYDAFSGYLSREENWTMYFFMSEKP